MKSLEQISLFASEEVTTHSYLHVVQDEEVKDLTLEELFDATKFTRIRAVSFVASPKFFFNMTKGFEEVQLVIGRWTSWLIYFRSSSIIKRTAIRYVTQRKMTLFIRRFTCLMGRMTRV